MSDFLEDLVIGETVTLGETLFTSEAIVGFASRYDPQAFHIDAEAARRGPFGRLAASGWHTAAAWMRCYVTHRAAERERMRARGEAVCVLGPSPGFRNLQWIRPVFADETIRFTVTVTSARASSRPGWGIVTQVGEGHAMSGEPVYRFEPAVLWQMRPAPAGQ